MARRARKFRFNNRTGRLVVDNNEIVDSSGELAISGGTVKTRSTWYGGEVSYSAPNNNVGTTIAALSTSIQPEATTNKVLVMICISYECHHDSVFRLYRGSTEIGRNTTSSSRYSGFAMVPYDTNVDSTPTTQTMFYLDSPNTTSNITYSIKIQSSSGGNYTLRLNRDMNNAGADARENASSSMFLMELTG